MKAPSAHPKDRTELLEEVAPAIAQAMGEALQRLTGVPISVGFNSIQTLEHDSVLVDAGEQCFGSYVRFRSRTGSFQGVVVALFPVASTRTLVELLIERRFGESAEAETDHQMKLSAFKEAVSILALTYVTGVANALKDKVDTSVPRFICSRNVQLARSALLRGGSRAETLVSVGHFVVSASPARRCGGGAGPNHHRMLRGAFSLFASREPG